MNDINKKNSNELIPSFFDSLSEPSIDLTSEILEIPIDQITDNEIIKQLPLVGSIVKLSKLSLAIRDRFLLKKTLRFIVQVNQASDSQKFQKHFKNLQSNKKIMEKELEHVLFVLDRLNNQRKSEILANFYISYIDKDIEFDWDDFCTFSEILEIFSVYDYETLDRLKSQPFNDNSMSINRLSLTRLNSLGLVTYFSGISVTTQTQNFIAKITPVGELFLDLGFRNSVSV